MWEVRWVSPDSGEVREAVSLIRQEYRDDYEILERVAAGLRGQPGRRTQEEVDRVIERYRAQKKTHPGHGSGRI